MIVENIVLIRPPQAPGAASKSNGADSQNSTPPSPVKPNPLQRSPSTSDRLPPSLRPLSEHNGTTGFRPPPRTMPQGVGGMTSHTPALHKSASATSIRTPSPPATPNRVVYSSDQSASGGQVNLGKPVQFSFL